MSYPKRIRVSREVYEMFLDLADPWRRELKRAKRQLARLLQDHD